MLVSQTRKTKGLFLILTHVLKQFLNIILSVNNNDDDNNNINNNTCYFKILPTKFKITEGN